MRRGDARDTVLRGASLALLAIAAACLVDCGEDDQSEPPCAGLCDRVRACSRGVSEQSCFEWCGRLRSTSRISDEVLRSLGECAVSQRCEALEDGSYWEPCIDRAREAIAPTAAAVDFCARARQRDLECGSDPDIGECVGNMKLFTPAVSAEAAGCLSRPTCKELATCYANVFDLCLPPLVRPGGRRHPPGL